MVKVCDSEKFEWRLRPDETICNEECVLGNARRETRRDTRIEVAKKLISQGVSASVISKATTLSIERLNLNSLKETERVLEFAGYNEASAIGYAKKVVRKELFIEIATELKAQGVSMEDIIRSTDLTIDEILQL